MRGQVLPGKISKVYPFLDFKSLLRTNSKPWSHQLLQYHLNNLYINAISTYLLLIFWVVHSFSYLLHGLMSYIKLTMSSGAWVICSCKPRARVECHHLRSPVLLQFHVTLQKFETLKALKRTSNNTRSDCQCAKHALCRHRRLNVHEVDIWNDGCMFGN